MINFFAYASNVLYIWHEQRYESYNKRRSEPMLARQYPPRRHARNPNGLRKQTSFFGSHHQPSSYWSISHSADIWCLRQAGPIRIIRNNFHWHICNVNPPDRSDNRPSSFHAKTVINDTWRRRQGQKCARYPLYYWSWHGTARENHYKQARVHQTCPMRFS